MGRRRRGKLYEILSRLVALRDRYPDASVLIIDRLSVTGLQRLSLNRVVRVKRDELVLDDGSVIPLHRIVAVEAGGKRLWQKGGGPDRGVRDEGVGEAEDKGGRRSR